MKESEFTATMIFEEDIFESPTKTKTEVKKNNINIGNKRGAFFVIVAGPEEGRVIFIDKLNMIIGRDVRTDIVIENMTVSKKHAKIITSGKKTTLIDLDSTNGIYVNSKRIKQTELTDEDEIKIGNLILKFFQVDLTGNIQAQDLDSNENPTSEYYWNVFNICEVFFGKTTKFFLDRQIATHVKKTPHTLEYSDRDILLKWIKISASLLLDDAKTQKLIHRIMSIPK